MHYARKNSPGEIVTVILDQIGPEQNRCLAFSTFTFKQGQNTKSDQINHYQWILYTFTMNLNSISYIQYIQVMVYCYAVKFDNLVLAFQ